MPPGVDKKVPDQSPGSSKSKPSFRALQHRWKDRVQEKAMTPYEPC